MSNDTHHDGQQLAECPGCGRRIRHSAFRVNNGTGSPIDCGGCDTTFQPTDDYE